VILDTDLLTFDNHIGNMQAIPTDVYYSDYYNNYNSDSGIITIKDQLNYYSKYKKLKEKYNRKYKVKKKRSSNRKKREKFKKENFDSNILKKFNDYGFTEYGYAEHIADKDFGYKGYNKYIDLYNQLYNDNKELTNDEIFEIYNKMKVVNNIDDLNKEETLDLLKGIENVAIIYVNPDDEK
jgi:hypothetical protein